MRKEEIGTMEKLGLRIMERMKPGKDFSKPLDKKKTIKLIVKEEKSGLIKDEGYSFKKNEFRKVVVQYESGKMRINIEETACRCKNKGVASVSLWKVESIQGRSKSFKEF